MAGLASGARGGSYDPESTRKALMDAARQMFEERGFHATTVDSIVVAASLTKGAYYHHFASKEDALLQIQEDYIDDRLGNCESIVSAGGSSREQLESLIGEAMVGIRDHRSDVLIFMQERRFLRGERFAAIKDKRDRINEIYEDVLREGVERGEFRSDLNPRIASFGILGMCAWAVTWYQPDGRLPVEEVAAVLARLVTDGMGARVPV